jgi:hypothetical protein
MKKSENLAVKPVDNFVDKSAIFVDKSANPVDNLSTGKKVIHRKTDLSTFYPHTYPQAKHSQ